MTSYFGAVEKAHSATGGNAAHLFINVTPGQRTPARNGNSAAAALQKNRIGDYNAALSAHVKQFAASHPTTKVMLFDANAWFEYALDSYAALGFENITGFCTCDDNSYFWYSELHVLIHCYFEYFRSSLIIDSGHPTEKVHELLAKNITAFLSAQS
jgi:phospholipase/lecithinase/hemolysin